MADEMECVPPDWAKLPVPEKPTNSTRLTVSTPAESFDKRLSHLTVATVALADADWRTTPPLRLAPPVSVPLQVRSSRQPPEPAATVVPAGMITELAGQVIPLGLLKLWKLAVVVPGGRMTRELAALVARDTWLRLVAVAAPRSTSPATLIVAVPLSVIEPLLAMPPAQARVPPLRM